MILITCHEHWREEETEHHTEQRVANQSYMGCAVAPLEKLEKVELAHTILNLSQVQPSQKIRPRIGESRTVNMVRWIVWIGNELQREEDIGNVFLFLSEKIAVPCGEILAMTLFWVFGAFFYQDLSHL